MEVGSALRVVARLELQLHQLIWKNILNILNLHIIIEWSLSMNGMSVGGVMMIKRK